MPSLSGKTSFTKNKHSFYIGGKKYSSSALRISFPTNFKNLLGLSNIQITIFFID